MEPRVDGRVVDLVGELVEGLDDFGEVVRDFDGLVVELGLSVLDADVGVVDLEERLDFVRTRGKGEKLKAEKAKVRRN